MAIQHLSSLSRILNCSVLHNSFTLLMKLRKQLLLVYKFIHIVIFLHLRVTEMGSVVEPRILVYHSLSAQRSICRIATWNKSQYTKKKTDPWQNDKQITKIFSLTSFCTFFRRNCSQTLPTAAFVQVRALIVCSILKTSKRTTPSECVAGSNNCVLHFCSTATGIISTGTESWVIPNCKRNVNQLHRLQSQIN